jgi:hypothetical protein
VLSYVRRALGATVASMLLIAGAGVAPASAETREGTVTVSSGGYEVTARVVVSDRDTTGSWDMPVDIYLEHDGTAISLDQGWVDVTDPAGNQVGAGDAGLTEVEEGHLRAVPRLQDATLIGDYRVSFTAFVDVQGHAAPALVRVGAVNLVTFQVRHPTVLEANARSGNQPTGTVTTVAGKMGWRVWRDAGYFSSVAATGAVVDIAFDPEGSGPRAKVGTATVSSTGFFHLDTRVTVPGRWYVSYAGSSEQNPETVRITQSARPHTRPVHQGTASRTSGDVTARIRVTATDVVTTLEPQLVRVDFGVTTNGTTGNTYGVRVEGRRGEGSYPNGRDYLPRHSFVGASSAGYITMKMDALTPPGVYDVGANVIVGTCTKWSLSGSCGWIDLPIKDDTITTLTVKRATITTISASPKVLDEPGWVTLKGSVRKLQLVSNTEAAYRYSAEAPVRLYWDPVGSAAPQYEKTVYTNSRGVWAAKFLTSASGRWVAEFPGTSLNAASSRTVWVAVE